MTAPMTRAEIVRTCRRISDALKTQVEWSGMPDDMRAQLRRESVELEAAARIVERWGDALLVAEFHDSVGRHDNSTGEVADAVRRILATSANKCGSATKALGWLGSDGYRTIVDETRRVLEVDCGE